MGTGQETYVRTQAKNHAGANWLAALDAEARGLVAAVDARPDGHRLFEGSLDAAGYIHYLVQTYHYARWSTPILGEAGERLKRLGRHPELAQLLIQKGEEERGHDRWLLSDLKNLGCSEESVETAVRSPAVEAYTGWNFFTSRAGVPTAVLGTAYVLEYLSQTRAGVWARRLKEVSAIPNIHKSVTFLRSHGALDGDHVAEMARLLERLTEPEDQEAILFSARIARSVYPCIFREVGASTLPLAG
ncbi:iron-containing redox enzyme family protein [Myxococcus sp. CA051A]|uniref:iron-containing redox enzyme family protein n=1 Tax=unclassified Myxococcus TaxID=2648731 RepID=UPI00157B94B2|nr:MULTISPECIES: iron-containing redox enzyme family protein [unclassified Myxococcus]NTX49770.1 iron-containing redox enzyme family protein [Myxococcus sp. CA039A]NTX62640.1 iron-containing redox enzyme family protein [Myxococcus sp. CA051A]